MNSRLFSTIHDPLFTIHYSRLMQRRSFLTTLATLALGSGLTSCQESDRQVLRLLALKNSIPANLLGEFTKSIQPTNPRVELVAEGQFKEIIAQLQEWYQTGMAEAKGLKLPLIPASRSAKYVPNLASIGDAWLATAIQSKTIQPIAVESLKNWSKLDTRWRDLARRDDRGNSSATGQVWGVPYRWGTTVILYHRSKLADANIPAPTDWADLWHPKLKQRVSLLDRSREVIGLTLKKLGYSYNLADISQAKNLQTDLDRLHQQVKFYSSDYYLQPFLMGDTWVAVAWSADAVDVVKTNPDIQAIVPRSGTAMFADLWVQPALSAKLSPTEKLAACKPDRLNLTQQWLDYCLQPKVSNQISLLTASASPLLTSLDPSEILPDVRQNQLILPAQAILANSEFIYPLSATSQAQYDRMWQAMRQVKITN
jgi:putative spermidine/putrescine transport system substrate-binding protein